MRILLIATNLYRSVGGGQSVYKKIIESTPEVEFHYFVTEEALNAQRPQNAHPIKLQMRRRLRILAPPPYSSYMLHALEEADRYARSVAGQTFDIVDVPDFYTFGSVLKHAFDHHRVRVGRIILAMHGNISNSIELNWGSAGNNVLEHRLMEQAQFKAADGVYGISMRYIKEWQSYFNRSIIYVDPAHFVGISINEYSLQSAKDNPFLYCIGRTERRKGNDLFIELIRWLRRDSFKGGAHVGDLDYSYQSIASSYLLKQIALRRELDIEYLPTMNWSQMNALFASRAIVVLPVRYDTLNLVALEALFSGCPAVISEKAGVCDYLDQMHPGLPYVKIDFNNFYDAVGKLQDLVDNYDQHRSALLNYLKLSPPNPSDRLNMESVYQGFFEGVATPTNALKNNTIPYEKYKRSFKDFAIKLAKSIFPTKAYQFLRRLILGPKSFFIEKIKQSNYLGDAKFFGVLCDAKFLPWRLRKIAQHPEYNTLCLREKLDEIYGNASNPLYRCNFWHDIARIERILGNELMAVTYELRILRLLGRDPSGLLPGVIKSLNRLGFPGEAQVAKVMFGMVDPAGECAYNFLKGAYQKNLTRLDKPWLLLKDYRGQQNPKVSVVVSLYNAADKLSFFLTALCQQTLINKGLVEIILVDSGSPADECQVVEDYLKHTPLNLVYARSAERETIQSAWNRGIGLAKSPYLVFLGVDETLYPEALEVLADELDANHEIDWVMANSLVTAVEENGVYKHDIMSYIRDGATKDNTYLETCYLSWVGGMYRRSLHARFGYYDETFGAAGDTEFKNRILAHIKVKFIPKMLGLFLNYPEGQTTASPKAEIEDLRAWYIHRTLGGVRYAFENRPIEDVEKLMCLSLGYRKSYCGHMSCDIEYAFYLAQYLKSRQPGSKLAEAALPGLGKMMDQHRKIEFANSMPSQLQSMIDLIRAWRDSAKYQNQHRNRLKSICWPCYSVLNDNRHEQHSWLWKSN